MANYNCVQLMGNITRDIELRTLQNGQSLAKFGMAVNRKYKSKNGDAKEEALFIDVIAWGKTGETIAKYCNTGSSIFIVGRLKLDTWDDKDTGKKRSKIEVVAESFQFIDGKPKTDNMQPPKSVTAGLKQQSPWKAPKENAPTWGAPNLGDPPF